MKSIGYLLYDALSFGLLIFVCSIISSYVVIPSSLQNSRLEYSAHISLTIIILSIVMMIFSGKYSDKPVQNTRSMTPWTWWKLDKYSK